MKTLQEIQQEMVNISADHLMKQRTRSLRAEGTGCVYHGVGGLMCAAAPFIEKYNSDLEGCTFQDLVDDHLEELIPLIRHAQEEDLKWVAFFGDRLQDIHDNEVPTVWPEYLRALCIQHGLKTPKSVLTALRYGDNWIEGMPR